MYDVCDCPRHTIKADEITFLGICQLQVACFCFDATGVRLKDPFWQLLQGFVHKTYWSKLWDGLSMIKLGIVTTGQVIINPPEDLDPGYTYNVGIPEPQNKPGEFEAAAWN